MGSVQTRRRVQQLNEWAQAGSQSLYTEAPGRFARSVASSKQGLGAERLARGQAQYRYCAGTAQWQSLERQGNATASASAPAVSKTVPSGTASTQLGADVVREQGRVAQSKIARRKDQ